MGSRSTNSFAPLKAFLLTRLETPLGHFSFWTYFILAIIGLGAVGVWVEVVRWKLAPEPETSGILTAIYTYFPAVAAGATLQLVMASREKYVRSFSILMASIIGAVALPHSVGLVREIGAFSWGFFGTVLALVLWWVANGTNQDFLDSTPEDSLGGNLADEPKGDTGGFNV